MIRTIADQFLAQNAGRRYPFRDDTELPKWFPDSGVLDFKCTVQGVPAGAAVEARLVETEHAANGQVQLTAALTAGGVPLDELVFVVPGNAADEVPYTAYASGSRSTGALTVTSDVMRLPYDAEVGYLESTGTQWIDTGVIPDSSVDFSITISNFIDGTMYGNVNGDTSGAAYSTWGRFQFGRRTNVTGANYLMYNFNHSAGSSWERASIDFSTAHSFQLKSDGFYIDDIKAGVRGTAIFSPNPSFALFAQHNPDGSCALMAGSRCFAAKFWINGVLVRDLVPVRFTNERGQREGAMFDRANPTVGMDPDGSARTDGLYRNRGTGVFPYGDDRPTEVTYPLNIPFAASTVVCDSLKVHTIQSAQSNPDSTKHDERDDTDPAARDTLAVLTGDVVLAEGRNAEPYLDGNRLRLDIFKGGGLGERCQSAVSGDQRCDTVLFSINGERPGSDGELKIVGEDGITVTPDPANHKVKIAMDGVAADRMADGCAPACSEG